MGGAMEQVRLVAPSPKRVAEALVRKWTPAVIDKEGQVAAGRVIDDVLQGRKDREAESLGLPIAAFELGEGQPTSLDMLPTKADDVGAPLSAEQQERHRQPSLRADWMSRRELLNLFERPSMVSSRAGLEVRNV